MRKIKTSTHSINIYWWTHTVICKIQREQIWKIYLTSKCLVEGLNINSKAVCKSYKKSETKALMEDQKKGVSSVGELYKDFNEAGSSRDRPWKMIIIWIHGDREKRILSIEKSMSIGI